MTDTLPPCYWCGGQADRMVLVELPVTRIDSRGQVVNQLARRIPTCNRCAAPRRRRFPAMKKARNQAWADYWAARQDRLL